MTPALQMDQHELFIRRPTERDTITGIICGPLQQMQECDSINMSSAHRVKRTQRKPSHKSRHLACHTSVGRLITAAQQRA